MILLKKVRLINWYGFSQITIPIGFFTLIAGKNGNGKSVLLDAIKYALSGDTVFNKSTENRGSRTVPSYTRGLLDATAGTYMRPVDQMPNVYTHIVLEMEEVEIERHFILGTVIDTDSSNSFVTRRYVIENKTLTDVAHTYEENGLTMPYSTSQLQKALGIKMMDVKEGVLKFMQRTGLRLNEQQLAAFRRKLRSIMSYDPNAKIDQFIRESVLEEKKVDFSKLIEAKKNIDLLNMNFVAIDEEIKELDNILKLFDALQNTRNIILADDVKLVYKRFVKCKQEIEEAIINIDLARRQIANDEKELERIKTYENELYLAYRKAKENLSLMDCSKAIEEAEISLKKAQDEKENFQKQKMALSEFQTRVSELMAWFYKENLSIPDQEILASLTLDCFTKTQKENRIAKLLNEVKIQRDYVVSEITRIKDALKDNQMEQERLQQIIDACLARKATFSEIPEYVALKNEINREFEKKGIASKACFACEYVIGLRDEDWRDAIESYLGKRRYTILVEPEYYDIADDVLNASKNKYAHLFNTKLLMKKKITVEEDAVACMIKTKNPVAKQYFDYQLGRFHGTTIDQVKKYENALSKEGRISVAMDSYFLRFERIKFYYLGQETLELNRIKAEKKLKGLKDVHKLADENLKIENEKKLYLETTISCFSEYNYDACSMYEAAMENEAKKQTELERLIEAQKNNFEYMELVEQVGRLEHELENVNRKQDAVRDDYSNMKSILTTNENRLKDNSERRLTIESELKVYEIKNYRVYTKAIDDYIKHLKNGSGSVGGTLKDRARSERALREAGDNLTESQATYNATRTVDNRLPISNQSRAEYEGRKTRIWMDDLQEIQQKLKQQTRRYEEIFKNEFVLTVLKSCESAKDDLKLINAELARLKFKSQYAFQVSYVKDNSDYEMILEYAKYLKEREELGISSGQMRLDMKTSDLEDKGKELEKDIRKIINRIVESNNKELIEHYADYRNYMTYEILLTNDVLTKAKLSKQAGYNSGAEVQIPYMLILLSALLMIYNDKLSSTRLVFIDEPFAKMDPTNVKIMLGFMKEQNLQMIFCAPDKTELIGNECEVILPVLRTQANLMEIGIIEMHKGV